MTDATSPFETRSFGATESPPADALAYLRREHQELSRHLKDFDRAADDIERVVAAERFCMGVALHAQVVEELFYPALRKAGVDPSRLDRGVVEHMAIRRLSLDVEAAAFDDPLFDAKIRVLAELALRHAGDAESGLFDAARNSGLDLAELGARMIARRRDLARQVARKLKTRLRAAGGPAAQMIADHPAPDQRLATPDPVRMAAAFADMGLNMLPGGRLVRRVLHPARRVMHDARVRVRSGEGVPRFGAGRGNGGAAATPAGPATPAPTSGFAPNPGQTAPSLG